LLANAVNSAVDRDVGQITAHLKILSSCSGKHKSLDNFAKSALWSARSVPHEGTYRDRHGRWQRNAVDAGGSQCVSACTDERPVADGQVVWFRYPDAGITLATTLARRAGHGGQQARRTRKSTKQLLKPSRREGRDVLAEPVVPAACIFFCRRAMGAASSRPSLRPLIFEGERDQHHSGSACRERANVCLQYGRRCRPQ
jgi:hypothetical protein